MIEKAVVLQKIDVLKAEVEALVDVMPPDVAQLQADLAAAQARVAVLENIITQIDALAHL